jgi:indole-3-glycerol phosphate synthase
MILDEIIADKLQAHRARAPVDEDQLLLRIAQLPTARPFAAALSDGQRRAPRVIAEFKRRSPSAGTIRAGADPVAIARRYHAAGAAALSVLTDEKFFDGRLEHLRAARDAVPLPILRKDFLLDERDLYEARLAGADAALLIVRILARPRLEALVVAARRAGLETLIEAHNDAEIETALAAGGTVIGVNHRDLDTLKIDLGLSARARKVAGPSVTLVAESGIQTAAHVAEMRAHGVDAILVGESLMRAEDPGAALETLLA